MPSALLCAVQQQASQHSCFYGANSFAGSSAMAEQQGCKLAAALIPPITLEQLY